MPVLLFSRVKDRPELKSIQSKADLTVLAMIVLVLVILVNVLFRLGGHSRWSLREIFARDGRALSTYFLFVGMVALSYLYTPAPESGWIKLTRLLMIDGLLFFIRCPL